MPAAPRNSNKTVKAQALVNLSLVRQVKGFNGETQPHGKLVNKGEVVELTEAEVANFGRFVRVIDDEHAPLKDIPEQSPAKTFGYKFVGKNGNQLKNSGAMDMGESTRVVSAAESVFEDSER